MIPFLHHPDESKSWKFVLQAHVRGLSVHGDLRLQITDQLLVGYTLNWIKSIPDEPSSLDDAKKIINPILKEAWEQLNDPHVKIVTELKGPEPMEWLKAEAMFPVETVGATKFKPGFMVILDSGSVEFGALKPYFREYFFQGEHMPKRFIFRQLPNVWRKKSIESGEVSKTGSDYTVWLGFAADPTPYAISQRAMSENWFPPSGFSALPKSIREKIPEQFRYWNEKDQKQAHTMRNKLVMAIQSDSIPEIGKFSSIIESIDSHDYFFSEDETLEGDGIYIVQPHAEWIARGIKTAIIKSRPFPNMAFKDLFLISNTKGRGPSNICYGTIKLAQPFPISRSVFKLTRPLHQVSDKEAEDWWQYFSNPNQLYMMKILDTHFFPEPKKVKIPQGVQTFVKNSSIEFI